MAHLVRDSGQSRCGTGHVHHITGHHNEIAFERDVDTHALNLRDEAAVLGRHPSEARGGAFDLAAQDDDPAGFDANIQQLAVR